MNSGATGLIVLAMTAGAWGAVAAQPAAPIQSPASEAGLTVTIDRLGAFDFQERTAAARDIRRAPAAAVVPLLERAARSHRDEYVRYRALVLLSGFGESAAGPVMQALVADHNDRIRTVVFEWFERHRTPAVLGALLDALPQERSEFVRPALTRALAASHEDPRAREALLPLVMNGEDLFRGAVIDALGDYREKSALPGILEVSRLDGPLQDDAVLAIGKIGDPSALSTLAAISPSAPPELQPAITAASCLLGTNCEAGVKYLKDTLTFALARPDEHEPLVRALALAMGALAEAGHRDVLDAMIDAGINAPDSARAPLALSIGAVALHQPQTMLEAVEGRPDLAAAVNLLRDAFDMLSDEAFAQEQFYVAMRKVYWAEPDGARKTAAGAIMEHLEF
jgi:HEAT repeat protein